ncbi:MAG: DUF5615 family PIN-like protein [Burkholderiales bacterium]|nr:DUF5615 family PIN-like protein [Burkholderiales bacterium]
MKFLLDENFPLPLYRRLRDKGYDAEHVIELGQRGATDAVLRARLAAEELVFLTNDAEFENIPSDFRSQVIISRLPQRLPTARRVDIWMDALERFAVERPMQRLFDLGSDGKLYPWEIIDGARISPSR